MRFYMIFFEGQGDVSLVSGDTGIVCCPKSSTRVYEKSKTIYQMPGLLG